MSILQTFSAINRSRSYRYVPNLYASKTNKDENNEKNRTGLNFQQKQTWQIKSNIFKSGPVLWNFHSMSLDECFNSTTENCMSRKISLKLLVVMLGKFFISLIRFFYVKRNLFKLLLRMTFYFLFWLYEFSF